MATWFYRIGTNCALDIVSRRRPEPQSRIAEDNDPTAGELQLADIKAGPDRLLLSREIEAAQKAAMSELTATERDRLRSTAYGRPFHRRDCSRFEHRPQLCKTGGVSCGTETEAPTGTPMDKHMKHLNEAELIEHYYDESASPADCERHLKTCSACAKHFADLRRDLDGVKPAVPRRAAKITGNKSGNLFAARCRYTRNRTGAGSAFGVRLAGQPPALS